MSATVGEKQFRVLSYNIHKGFTSRNRAFVLKQIRESIREVSADFVMLQEVLGEHQGHQSRIEDWPQESQFEYMADEIWPHYAYGKNAVYVEGHHGNAILSKHPIATWENEDISTSALERRGILHAVVRPFDDRPELHLVCTHFGLFDNDRRLQAHRLCDRLKRTVTLGQAVIAAGDFNDWTLRLSPIFRHQAGLAEAYELRHRRHARTFPARMPVLRLDRIYFHGLEVKMAKCLHAGLWGRLSDHAPLLATFEWT